MKIVQFETWWVKRAKCLLDEKRKGGSTMDWDVIVIKLTCDNGIEGLATALAARSGNVTESYLHDNIAPVIMGRDPHCLLYTSILREGSGWGFSFKHEFMKEVQE